MVLSKQTKASVVSHRKSQPRSQGLSFLPPLVVGKDPGCGSVAAGYVATQNLGVKKSAWRVG